MPTTPTNASCIHRAIQSSFPACTIRWVGFGVVRLGVAAGTSSLSEWMSHHPRIRWVRRPQHLYYREAHVFDIPPDAAEWRRSATSPSSLLRDRLAVEARKGDTVVDCEWGYGGGVVRAVPSVVGSVLPCSVLRQGGPLDGKMSVLGFVSILCGLRSVPGT